MVINIVDKVIKKNDLKIIEDIAKKYDMSLVEFGRFIGKLKNEKGVRHHVRFSDDELTYVDKKAKDLNLSRSEYCFDAAKYFIQKEVYKKVDVKDLREANGDRGKRVCVSFTNGKEYINMWQLAKGFSIPFSTLIRYCALNYPKN